MKRSIRSIDYWKVSSTVTSWTTLWDQALHLGTCRTYLEWWHISSKPCPLCDDHTLTQSLIQHVLALHHVDIPLSKETLLTLVDGDIRFVYRFWSLDKFWSIFFFSPMYIICLEGLLNETLWPYDLGPLVRCQKNNAFPSKSIIYVGIGHPYVRIWRHYAKCAHADMCPYM